MMETLKSIALILFIILSGISLVGTIVYIIIEAYELIRFYRDTH